jgi:hypothetical protein
MAFLRRTNDFDVIDDPDGGTQCFFHCLDTFIKKSLQKMQKARRLAEIYVVFAKKMNFSPFPLAK